MRGLVSRDATELSEPLVAAAAIESVAENTTDSFIAPWLAFALIGLPGAFAYRAVNTLDSMIGYRGEYEYLGKASARLDDLLNLIPARISAGLLLLAGAVSGSRVGQGWQTALREHRLTASPNAGWTIAAMAGLLSVSLEKPGNYLIGGEFTVSQRRLTLADAVRAGVHCRRAWYPCRSQCGSSGRAVGV